MPISQEHHDLFHSSSAMDKLALFQSLLETRDLNFNEALALLNTIHTELGQSKGLDHAVYVKYAKTMEALRHEMPEIYQEVTSRWQDLHFMLMQGREEANAKEVVPDDWKPPAHMKKAAKASAGVHEKAEPQPKTQKVRGKLNEEELEEMEAEEGEEEGEEEEEKEEEETEEGEEEEADEEKEEGEEEAEGEEEKEEGEEEEAGEEEEGEEEEGEEEKEEGEEEEAGEEEEGEEEEGEEGAEESEEEENPAGEAAEAAEEMENPEVELEMDESESMPQMTIEDDDIPMGDEEEPPMGMED